MAELQTFLCQPCNGTGGRNAFQCPMCRGKGIYTTSKKVVQPVYLTKKQRRSMR